MNNAEFTAWSRYVKSDLLDYIHNHTLIKGEYPEAIIAGGEYMHAIMADPMDIQFTIDGGYLWRGIPFIRCSGLNGVKLVWRMDDVILPEPPKGE